MKEGSRSLNLDEVWMPEYKKIPYFWTPPPTGGLIVVEQLRRARNKREKLHALSLFPD